MLEYVVYKRDGGGRAICPVIYSQEQVSPMTRALQSRIWSDYKLEHGAHRGDSN